MYKPQVTNYRQDYSSIRNNNWISHYQHASTHRRKTDDGTAKVMVGIFITLVLMGVIGFMCK